MNRFRILILLISLMLLLVSCASLKPADKYKLLRDEMARWQNFRAEGVASASHSGLTLRKMYILGKTVDAARLDVLDGGAFGVAAGPLVSAFLGEYLAIDSDLMPQLEGFAAKAGDTGRFLALLADPDTFVSAYGEDAVLNGSVSLPGIDLGFSEMMQLESISDSGSGARIDVTYNSKGDPDRVRISIGTDTSLELLVDSISYGNASAEPLPANEPSALPDTLMDMLEGVLE
jgi:hypothetical protein